MKQTTTPKERYKTKAMINTKEMLLQRAVLGKAKLVGTLHGVEVWSDVDMPKNVVYGLKDEMEFEFTPPEPHTERDE